MQQGIKQAGRLNKFTSLPRGEKLLLAEAYFLHLTAGSMLRLIPFRKIPVLFRNRESSDESLRTVNIEEIKLAIQRAGRLSPWKNKCLVSSLAARLMLRKRHITSTLFLGVTKNSSGRLIAHAWLIAGNVEIVPKNGDFTPLYTI